MNNKAKIKITLLIITTVFLMYTYLIFAVKMGTTEPLKSTPAQQIQKTKPNFIDNRWTEVTATAYCKCFICCGKLSANGVTASGQIARSARTIAADLSFYPIGTRLYIKDLGIRVVEDTGGAMHNRDIDIYFDTHDEALQFGRQTLYVKEIL